MKAVLSFLLVVLISMVHGNTQPVIKNTRAEACVDGKCGSVCAWDGEKIFQNDELNQKGKCRHLQCTSDFSVKITNCPVDITGKYHWVGKDNTKLYPDCCGFKTLKT